MKTLKHISITLILLLSFAANASTGTTRYVSPSGSHTAPYLTLATAANTFQAAIDISNDNDLILVDDGTYLLTNRISVTKGVIIRSINGSASAIVDGNHAVKCFYINHPDAILDGFTIQNAHNTADQYGGGVNISNGGTVQNCIIQNNQAIDGGGIAIDYSGLVQNCIIRNNLASNNSTSGYGGGIRFLNGGEARNCLITENVSVQYGGGINIWNAGSVFNCTITKNAAPHGAGIRTRNASLIKNCIIYYNTGGVNWEVNGSGYHYYNCATTPALGSSYSTNCITNIPAFINITSGSEDYHLQSGSACIDAGYNLSWMNISFDLDGNARIFNSIVDMGCYEFNTPTIIDTDGDGVPDDDDDFPNDPGKAFINNFPASGNGSLGFEDLWPGTGDYDFNDIVLDYKFVTITNASNKVVQVNGTFIIKASGAYLRNGFGFNLPNANISLISGLNISGYDLREGFITLNSNGTESGQSKPTIIVFDDVFNLLTHPGVGTGVNTENWAPFVPYDTLTITMTPSTLNYTMNDFSMETWNPFIIVNHERGKEVHLINYPPTDLANLNFFGTWEDNSNLSQGKYYRSLNGLPWAINITEPFEWPREKIEIGWAYFHFIEWAQSSGATYPDWYKNYPGYRNNGNLYHPNIP